jgi:hypothetical protein
MSFTRLYFFLAVSLLVSIISGAQVSSYSLSKKNTSYRESPVKLRMVTIKNGLPKVNDFCFTITAGDKAVLDLENTGNVDYYFTLIDIQPDNEIIVLYPNASRSVYTSPDSVFIPANQRIEWGDTLKAVPPFGTERLLLIASKTPEIGRMIDTGPLSKQKQALQREIKWILQGEPSRLFKDCFFSLMDMVIIPRKEGNAGLPLKKPVSSRSGLSHFFSIESPSFFSAAGDEKCIDKIKDPENLFTKYPLINFFQPIQAGATRGETVVHDVEDKRYVIKGFVSSRKIIKDVLVTGGKESMSFEVKRDTSNSGSPQSSWEAQVTLEEGKNNYKVTVITTDGFENCEELVLNYKEKPKQQINEPRNYSLFIGINKYQYWETLDGAQFDAKSIRTLLKDSFDFNDKYAIELYDKAATYDKIDSVFRKLIDSLSSNDNLLVYYAGHGTIDPSPKINEGYWIPVDAKKDRPRDYISNSTIQKYLEALPVKHAVVFADACFSGSFFETNTAKVGQRSLKDEDDLGSKWLFCSGRKTLVADKMWGQKNSPFAFYLMKYLKEAPEDGIKVGRLYEVLKNDVKKEEDGDQTPIAGPINLTGDEGGQFLFKKKKIEKIQPPKQEPAPKTTLQKPPPAKPKVTPAPKKKKV